MVRFVEVVAVILVAITMALTLAHALEFSGSCGSTGMSISRSRRFIIPGSRLAAGPRYLASSCLPCSCISRPSAAPGSYGRFRRSRCLWRHGIYWVFTHPVNNFWLSDVELSGLGSAFFSAFAPKTDAGDWTSLRDVWEYSHVAHAALAMLSLIAITIAVSAGHPPGEPGSG